jgi:hypothetical protein
MGELQIGDQRREQTHVMGSCGRAYRFMTSSGSRYTTLATRADLSNAKLYNVIADVTALHLNDPDIDHIAGYVEQWRETRKLTSIQLLSILGMAMRDEDMHLHFDYSAMHNRWLTLLYSIRGKFIVGTEVISREPTTTGELVITLSEILEDAMMPEESGGPIITSSIFLADRSGK